ncbi:hypothetical protein KR222_010985 [Zaprionus bogoriensis]|nr:hypothetical protein KR222_010985 [Zaprionus bogoriensis]
MNFKTRHELRTSRKNEIATVKLKTAHELHTVRKNKISTSIDVLDKALRGGISLGKITELVGRPGTGKTQICLKLCLNVQTPKIVGGVEGKALYIDTRRDFHPKRLNDLALDKDQLTEVFYLDSPTTAKLMANVYNCHRYLSEDPSIKLIVIDSITFAIRMMENIRDRTALLIELHDHMHRLICKYNVAIVLTNELGFRPYKRRWLMEPILGKNHTHLLNQRIWLTEKDCFVGKTLKTQRSIGKLDFWYKR